MSFTPSCPRFAAAPRHPLALAAAALLATAAQAQQTIIVTGNPLGRDTPTQAATVLSGDGLQLRRASTLGATLDGLPGVSSTWYGPNASRPVIRGLDGDRVRLLDNGGASIDASNLSFDHAAATDPLVTERVEVLRGPAALLYGGNATGGVVNSIDNRIPKAAAAAPLTGRAEWRFGGAAREQALAAVLEGGQRQVGQRFATGGLAWHVDGFDHRSEDLRVPLHTPIADGEALAPALRIRNSAARGDGGAAGASWVWGQGFVGASVESNRNAYGITVEPDVTIRLQRERASVAGEWRGLDGFISKVSVQGSRTRYQHQEVEGAGADAEVGTTFRSQGDDGRIQVQHRAWRGAWGSLAGVWGLQGERLDFQALGEEAFVPATTTTQRAVFGLEEWTLPTALPQSISLGVRAERVKVSSAGDAGAGEDSRFGNAQSRQFSPGSLSLGWRLGGAEGWQLQASGGRTERAPAYYELYANGLHLATGTFEVGDPTLGVETSRHGELGLSFRRGETHLKANVFATRFGRYIALDDTGTVFTDDKGGSAPIYAFRAARVNMKGVEVEAETELLPARAGRAWALKGNAGVDVVRGDNLDRQEPLARLAPVRVHVGLSLAFPQWSVGANVRSVARQNRVPATDTATAGYTLVDLWAQGRLPVMAEGATWFLRMGNVGDRLAYNAATSATMRGLAPLAGRALTAGVRLRF